MKFQIEISDEEVKEMAKRLLADKLVQGIDSGHGFGWTYRKDVKEVVRDVLKERMDDLSNRAVQAASKSIENRAVKKLLDKLMDEEANYDS